MEFGITFFPAVGPDVVPADKYFSDALELTELGEELGLTHVRTVEHYFHPYGGYSPNPIVFLAAAAQRTRRMRLITGAVLPVFNHPLKLAGEIGMLDALSGGRAEIGFARAFVPQEFGRFGISLDESRGRFDEGLAAVTRLLEDEDVELDGRFHRFPATTSYPRPTQLPRPPFWVACATTPESFSGAGTLGHAVMCNPISGAKLNELIGLYRDAWRAAGHPGNGKIMLAFHMFCHEDEAKAREIAREPLNRYLRSLADAAGDWVTGASSADYRGYDRVIAKLQQETFESQVESGAAWVGTPATIVDQIRSYHEEVGGFEVTSVQVNFFDLGLDDARRSMELFAQEVLPQVRDL